MTEAEDKENLVQHTMTSSEFLKLFPWSKLVKFYLIFLIYTGVASVIFFSTEQCLSDHANHSKQLSNIADAPLENHNNNGDSPKQRNCSSVQVHFGSGIHEHAGGSENDGKVISVKKCGDEEAANETPDSLASPSNKCSLKSMTVMKWVYFTVVHLHGAGT